MVIDLDRKRGTEQQELVGKYYQGYIPHVVILDKQGNPIYNSAGEVDEGKISALLDNALK